MSVQVSYKKQFALGFLLIIILIGVIEISVRVYEVTLPECVWINFDAFESNEISKKICQDLKKIQYQYLGNYLLLEPKQDDLTFTTNSHGFRGPEFEIEKEPGTYRIFIVGGSAAMGFGASSDVVADGGSSCSDNLDSFASNSAIFSSRSFFVLVLRFAAIQITNNFIVYLHFV